MLCPASRCMDCLRGAPLGPARCLPCLIFSCHSSLTAVCGSNLAWKPPLGARCRCSARPLPKPPACPSTPCSPVAEGGQHPAERAGRQVPAAVPDRPARRPQQADGEWANGWRGPCAPLPAWPPAASSGMHLFGCAASALCELWEPRLLSPLTSGGGWLHPRLCSTGAHGAGVLA